MKKKKTKLTLIPDWKKAWKFSTIQWGFLGLVLMTAFEMLYQGWIALPPQVSERIPNSSRIALIIYLLVMVGRLYKLIREDSDDEEDSK